MPYQNFFATRLATDIGASDTVIQLETIPTATSGRLVLEARNATQREVIKYTGIAGTSITGVTRGQGGTTAKSHVKNSLVEMNATAEDLQDLYDAFNTFAASANDWRTASTSVTNVTATGNRFYDVTVSSDLSNIISTGMRFRSTRTVDAPTMSAKFNGTNQYLNDTSVAGMTFTDDFVVGGWIKLDKYQAGQIFSRYNGTSGWSLGVNAIGQLELYINNGGSGNYSGATTIQSIPLNEWTYITAQLDASTYTATSTTTYMMINGADVPITLNRGGTNPTALIQAGNLEVGSRNGGISPFSGSIAQVWVSSAKITQANIRTLYSQGLTSSLITSNNIVSAYSLSNTLNDLNTSNANNLTNNNATVINNPDAPFGTQAGGTINSKNDFGVVRKVTSSVITVEVPEGNTIPTSGGVSSIAYSGVESPFGFPASKIDSKLVKKSITTASGVVLPNGTYAPLSYLTVTVAEPTRVKITAETFGGNANSGGNRHFHYRLSDNGTQIAAYSPIMTINAPGTYSYHTPVITGITTLAAGTHNIGFDAFANDAGAVVIDTRTLTIEPLG